VDPDGPGGQPLTLFESGAILIYLAEKTGELIPTAARGRYICLQWLMFQMSGIGPMFGQYNHFANYAPEKLPYAIERYGKEAHRLVRVLQRRLAGTAFLAGAEYSIADIATFPWMRYAAMAGGVAMDDAPDVQRWIATIEARPAVERGMAVLTDQRRAGPMTDQQRDILFGATQYAAR
jgi:GST-like protein